jgi:undecaprenyl-diphosphatase
MLIIAVALGIGVLAAVVARWLLERWPRLDPSAPGGAVHAVGEQVRDAQPGFLRARLDPRTETGLALTLAIVVVIAGGALLAALAFTVRSDPTMLRVDRWVATWSETNATSASTTVLRAVTQLGSTVVVVSLAVLVVAWAAATGQPRRSRVVTAAAYLTTVVVGQNLIANFVKVVVDRARPAFHPLAGFSGPSFPSGHTTAAFACYCAFAVVLGRGRGQERQTTLLAVALGIAASVGASRALLGVHWTTDVIAGAALGLAWFSLSTVAFGGRLMRFGAPVIAGERAERLAEVADDRSPSGDAAPG